jgi:hypothetical protein
MFTGKLSFCLKLAPATIMFLPRQRTQSLRLHVEHTVRSTHSQSQTKTAPTALDKGSIWEECKSGASHNQQNKIFHTLTYEHGFSNATTRDRRVKSRNMTIRRTQERTHYNSKKTTVENEKTHLYSD